MFWEEETVNTPEMLLSGWELEAKVWLCGKPGCFLSTYLVVMLSYDS